MVESLAASNPDASITALASAAQVHSSTAHRVKLYVQDWLGGGGFPGVPAAIVDPSLRVTLLEATQKKCAFLEAVKRELGLSLEVIPQRFEHFLQTGRVFSRAVSRATWAPPEWVLRGAALVAPGGRLLAMLGRERPPIVTPAHFVALEQVEYPLPSGELRALARFQRITE